MPFARAIVDFKFEHSYTEGVWESLTINRSSSTVPATYRMCTKCVMDTSDSEIVFDHNGICNHCHRFDELTLNTWYPNEEGAGLLQQLITSIRKEGRGKEFDCIIGVSGGLDSSYLTLKVAEFNLRPLVVHVDCGWNSEIAVSNIEKLVSHCGFELHTHVMEWEEMRDLQLAYLKAGVANQDVPQDHAIEANLYRFAIQNGIRTVLSGGNSATEGICPPDSWHASATDAINLKAIHRRWGTRPLKRYKTIGFWAYYFWYPIVKRMNVLRPLNYMPYSPETALFELQRSCGWRSYGRKHGESLFTRFFQNYFLPEKFGYDKRLPHLSSLIASGLLSRDEALTRLNQPLYEEDELNQDMDFFCKKLGISTSDLQELLHAPQGHYTDYANWDKRYTALKRIQRLVEKFRGKRITGYS